MPSSWTQLHVHLVWSTKRRQPFIDPALESRLHPFLGGIARDLGCVCVAVGGTEDHVHLLVRVRADLAVSDLARHLKSRSSKWVHETDAARQTFAWQAGYGAFSVSESQVPVIVMYIERQKEHHRKLGFEAEFMQLLALHGMSPRPDEVFQDDQ